MYFTLQLEIKVPPGASGKKCLARCEGDHLVSGAEATEDLRPTTPLWKKKILAAYEGIRAASEVIGTETQLFLAPQLPVLSWMSKGNQSPDKKDLNQLMPVSSNKPVQTRGQALKTRTVIVT
ncbi:hypothetical protein BTVI_07030 [Pitangus sulphuratus]|nr:hypothetical protein BTVI_07030 [Pitangus sulphuratus]